MGNRKAKKRICMIHGHELRWWTDGGRGGGGWRGKQGRKKWDSCNNIINKIYFLKKNAHNSQPQNWKINQQF